MALDQELIGVIGACSALFVMFCVIAAFVGYFCLRRARRRRQERLLEEAQKEEEKRRNSHMKNSLTHSRQSTARSNATSNNMSSYRPKILDHSLVNHAYDGSSRSSLRDGRAISTIFVGDKRSSGRKKEINNLDYNQMNGFIVKGFLHSPDAEKTLSGISSRNGQVKSDTFVTTLDQSHGFILEEPEVKQTEHHVIRQNVEMGADGKLVVSKYQQQADSSSLVTASSSHMQVEHNQVNISATAVEGIRLVEESPRSLTASVGGYSGIVESTSVQEQDSFNPYSSVVEMSNNERTTVDQIVQSVDSHSTTTGLELNIPQVEEDVYSTVMKIKTTDHYKVIKREHSTHTKVPEWPVTNQTVDEVTSDITLNSGISVDINSPDIVAEQSNIGGITDGTHISPNFETVTEFTTISTGELGGVGVSQVVGIDTSEMDHSVMSHEASSSMIAPDNMTGGIDVSEAVAATKLDRVQRNQPKPLASTITSQESETVLLRHVSIYDKQYINNTDPLVGEGTSVAAKIRAFEQSRNHSSPQRKPPPKQPKPVSQSAHIHSVASVPVYLPPLYEDNLASHFPPSASRIVSFAVDTTSFPSPPSPPPPPTTTSFPAPPSPPPPPTTTSFPSPPSPPPPPPPPTTTTSFISSSKFNSLPTPPPTPPSSPNTAASMWTGSDGHTFVNTAAPSGFGVGTAQIDFGDEDDVQNRINDFAENEGIPNGFNVTTQRPSSDRRTTRVTFG